MNNHILITLPCSQMRNIARQALKEHWKEAALVTFVYTLALSLPAEILKFLMNGVLGSDAKVATTLVGVYTILIEGALAYGYTLYMLSLFRRKEHSTGQIFSGFENYAKTLALFLLQALYIFLWTLLLIVPGIIKAFSYSQSFYILVDHPEYTPNQCITASKEMMAGNKGKFLLLCLSFIGWMILAGIPSGIVMNVFVGGNILAAAAMSPSKVLLMNCVDFIANIGLYFVSAYMIMAQTVMYELMAGHLKPVPYEAGFVPNSVSEEPTSFTQEPSQPAATPEAPASAPVEPAATPVAPEAPVVPVPESEVAPEENSDNQNQDI